MNLQRFNDDTSFGKSATCMSGVWREAIRGKGKQLTGELLNADERMKITQHIDNLESFATYSN